MANAGLDSQANFEAIQEYVDVVSIGGLAANYPAKLIIDGKDGNDTVELAAC